MMQAAGKTQELRVGERLLTQRDRRADGGARQVRLKRGDILIARRFGGVSMMIAAPVKAYRGVGLVAFDDLQSDILYRLALIHRDADLDIVLGEFRDGAEAQAVWSEWAAWFGLSQLALQGADWVRIEAPAGVRSGARRRHPSMIGRRRPAFLARRTTGDMHRLADIFTNEREIAGYE